MAHTHPLDPEYGVELTLPWDVEAEETYERTGDDQDETVVD